MSSSESGSFRYTGVESESWLAVRTSKIMMYQCAASTSRWKVVTKPKLASECDPFVICEGSRRGRMAGRSVDCAVVGGLSSFRRMRGGMLSSSSVSLSGISGGGWSESGSLAMAWWCSAMARWV